MKRCFSSSVLLLVWLVLQTGSLVCAMHCGDRVLCQEAHHQAVHSQSAQSPAIQGSQSVAQRQLAFSQLGPVPAMDCDLPCCANASLIVPRVFTLGMTAGHSPLLASLVSGHAAPVTAVAGRAHALVRAVYFSPPSLSTPPLRV